MNQLKPKWQCKTVNGVDSVFSDMVVYRSVSMGYAGASGINENVGNWMTSAAGIWVRDHSVEPISVRSQHNFSSDNFEFAVIAVLSAADQTFYRLKYQ